MNHESLATLLIDLMSNHWCSRWLGAELSTGNKPLPQQVMAMSTDKYATSTGLSGLNFKGISYN